MRYFRRFDADLYRAETLWCDRLALALGIQPIVDQFSDPLSLPVLRLYLDFFKEVTGEEQIIGILNLGT